MRGGAREPHARGAQSGTRGVLPVGERAAEGANEADGPFQQPAREGTMLKPGDKAPDFVGKDQDGNTVKLSDFKGKTVVLWFYPKADTPG